MVTVYWRGDADNWVSGKLLQMISRGNDVFGVVALKSGRIYLIDYDRLRTKKI